MRILHSSDLHGHYKLLLRDHADTEFDLWLDTGDFLDNKGRGQRGRIEPDVEQIYQHRWLSYRDLPRRLAAWLRGRPALLVGGNHDFIDLRTRLALVGANATSVTTEGVELLGLRWAGFREINYIEGEWAGETHDPSVVADLAFKADPDVLVTHAPPLRILDSTRGYGISALTTFFSYRGHRIRAHFFGHAHEDGGKEREEMGVRFCNGACHATLHDLNLRRHDA